MKNELNLFIMSPDEVAQWYKPQSPEEQYLVDLISSVDFTKQKELEDEINALTDETDSQSVDIHDLEEDVNNLKSENRRLNNLIDELEDEIESLERENNSLKDLVKTLNDDILNLQ